MALLPLAQRAPEARILWWCGLTLSRYDCSLLLCLQGEAAGPHFLKWACSLQSAGGGRQAGACPVYTFFSGSFLTSHPGFAA